MANPEKVTVKPEDVQQGGIESPDGNQKAQVQPDAPPPTLLGSGALSTQALEKNIANAELFAKMLDRIRKISLQLTNTDDWIDEGGHPYLQSMGCSKIAGAFGLQVTDIDPDKEVIKDDRGEYIQYTFSGFGIWNGNSVHEMGSASTRDDFFAKKGGVLLPLSEIDLGDVRKKAHTNLMNRLTKRMLGISFTWEEIAAATNGKITREKCGKVAFKQGAQGGKVEASPEAEKMREQIRAWIIDTVNGDVEAAKNKLKELTAWPAKNFTGHTETSKLSEAQIKFLHPKVKALWETHMADLNKQEKAAQ